MCAQLEFMSQAELPEPRRRRPGCQQRTAGWRRAQPGFRGRLPAASSFALIPRRQGGGALSQFMGPNFQLPDLLHSTRGGRVEARLARLQGPGLPAT